jgi:hypothetical protein
VLAAVLIVLWRRGRRLAPSIAVALMLFAFAGEETFTTGTGRPSAASSALAFDSAQASLAYKLKVEVSPDTTIAASAIGQVGYFTRDQVIDLLGFTDAHIAKERPKWHVVFPGHNKWDLSYSLTTSRPDVILGSWPATGPSSLAEIRRLGYVPIASDVFVRRDSRKVNRSALAAIFASGAQNVAH